MPKVMKVIAGLNIVEEVRSIDITHGASLVDVRIEKFDGRVELYSMPPRNFRMDNVGGTDIMSLEGAILEEVVYPDSSILEDIEQMHGIRNYTNPARTYNTHTTRGIILDKVDEVDEPKKEVQGSRVVNKGEELGNMIDNIEI